MLYLIPLAGVLALVFAAVKANWVRRQDDGNDTMREIAASIQEGAMAFLTREYRVLAIFVVVVAAAAGLRQRQPGRVALAGGRQFPRGRLLLGPGRLLRHAHRHPGQRAHHQRGAGQPEPGPGRGIQRRRRHGHERGRTGCSRAEPALHPLQQHVPGSLGHDAYPAGHLRLLPGRQQHRAVRPRGRRHLHQGRRRGRRPGGQGRGRHPRGRPAQPRRHRRQRGRQRGRRGRHGRRPLRVLRGLDRRFDDPGGGLPARQHERRPAAPGAGRCGHRRLDHRDLLRAHQGRRQPADRPEHRHLRRRHHHGRRHRVHRPRHAAGRHLARSLHRHGRRPGRRHRHRHDHRVLHRRGQGRRPRASPSRARPARPPTSSPAWGWACCRRPCRSSCWAR